MSAVSEMPQRVKFKFPYEGPRVHFEVVVETEYGYVVRTAAGEAYVSKQEYGPIDDASEA